MTDHDPIQILHRNHLLWALRRRCIDARDDLMDALQFCDDLAYPMDHEVRSIAQSVRKNEPYFSDSIVDDLLEILDDLTEIADEEGLI